MPESRKPKKPASSAAQRGNVLVESLQKEIGVVAEGVIGLASHMDKVETRLSHVEAKVDIMEPIVQSLAGVPDQLKTLMADMTELKGDMKDVKERLTSVESSRP